MSENGFGKRIDDNMGVLGQIARKNPFVALILASLGSFVTSMLTVFTLITDPIKSNLSRLEGEIQINSARVHEITQKMSSSNNSEPDIAKLYERTEDMRRDVTAIELRVDRIQQNVSKLQGVIIGIKRDYDKLYTKNEH